MSSEYSHLHGLYEQVLSPYCRVVSDQRRQRSSLCIPFVGRLDDRGDNGMQVVRNIKDMYRHGDGHVHVLAASLRKMEHLLYAFGFGVELATAPACR